MAIFTPNIKVETINKCNDLKITDNSIFTVETPKSLYESRVITITKTDGSTQTIDFSIGDNDPDTITLTDYLKGKDYYISLEIVYSAEEINPDYIVTWNGNHISTCNALISRSKLLNTCNCGCEDSECTISKLTKLDTSIENSIYAASFSLGEIAQAFLDQSLNIAQALESDCNCK